MNSNFTKFLALLLSLLLVFSFVACNPDTKTTADVTEKKENVDNNDENTEDSQNNPYTMVEGNELSADNLKYVMIYNPYFKEEYDDDETKNLYTGDFDGQIDNEYEIESLNYQSSTYSNTSPRVSYINNSTMNVIDGINYNVGDIHEFYGRTGESWNVTLIEMVCVSVGKYCHVWVPTDVDLSETEKERMDNFAQRYDKEVYEPMVSDLGAPRFVGKTGKINLLAYQVPPDCGGFFLSSDLYTEEEAMEYFGTTEEMNFGHAIVHIEMSSVYTDDGVDMLLSLAAHEGQHLFAASRTMESGNFIPTWLDEGMAGYYGKRVFESDADYTSALDYVLSETIRNGGSFYEFNCSADTGAYQVAYFLTKYLAEKSGSKVYGNIHNLLADTENFYSGSQLLYGAVRADFKQEIDEFLSYPENLMEAEEADIWLSKFLLAYNLNFLQKQLPKTGVELADVNCLLYRETSGTVVGAGGRVIVPVKGTKFTIPEDADKGLIYVGLDDKFNVVTSFYY